MGIRVERKYNLRKEYCILPFLTTIRIWAVSQVELAICMGIKMKIGNKEFNTVGKTYIMGILNVTPDSFSDGGKWNRSEDMLKHTEQMIKEGADIIDIGGESTRPGYTLLSAEEEISRIAPAIELIKRNFDIPVSIDTYKAEAAKAAINSGADLINDIWGLKYNGEQSGMEMAAVIAESGLPCCLMHNRVKKLKGCASYSPDLIEEVCGDLQESINIALQSGIQKDAIIIDPGIGFAKTYEHNLYIMNHLEELHKVGYPILLGTSRKSMIGLTLDLPPDQRLEGTLATTVMGVIKGCMFVRVHDVLENSRIIKMTEAILCS